ncbi:CCDC94 [Cordylochernes scorpioides]|uniref:Splicing factor YJU2 n=1 Tax=Cordylochernes scorpioides TaxID=51811 RepID=A0ABY6K9G9_9ARAC|nr:CCDC94 [Cordylochernes scorpioides]
MEYILYPWSPYRKYYPPDFDPSKIPRLRLPKNRQYTVRLMAPCNMRCTTCGEYIYKGKKFNARKETVENEEYLGTKVFRFYIKCPRCLAEITFKTDPANADYAVEHGATRNFQALKLAEEQAEREAREEEEEEKSNPMKLLEKRTKTSKQEMEILESLEELRDVNQRQVRVDYEALLHHLETQQKAELDKQEREDEEFLKSIYGKKEVTGPKEGDYIKLLPDEDTKPVYKKPRLSSVSLVDTQEDKKVTWYYSNPTSECKIQTITLKDITVTFIQDTQDNQPKELKSSLTNGPLVIVKSKPKKKPVTEEAPAVTIKQEQDPEASAKPQLLSLCAYSDSDESS